jgi:Fis family transcriptional regulator
MSREIPQTADKPGTPRPVSRNQTLRACVNEVITAYLGTVDDDFISNLYDTVLAEVEPPLLEAVMQKARSNQSKAAQMLGLNRGTLRKKLRQYDML